MWKIYHFSCIRCQMQRLDSLTLPVHEKSNGRKIRTKTLYFFSPTWFISARNQILFQKELVPFINSPLIWIVENRSKWWGSSEFQDMYLLSKNYLGRIYSLVNVYILTPLLTILFHEIQLQQKVSDPPTK